jgi:hypothetical protein
MIFVVLARRLVSVEVSCSASLRFQILLWEGFVLRTSSLNWHRNLHMYVLVHSKLIKFILLFRQSSEVSGKVPAFVLVREWVSLWRKGTHSTRFEESPQRVTSRLLDSFSETRSLCWSFLWFEALVIRSFLQVSSTFATPLYASFHRRGHTCRVFLSITRKYRQLEHSSHL